jgi:hypothetical protein
MQTEPFIEGFGCSLSAAPLLLFPCRFAALDESEERSVHADAMRRKFVTHALCYQSIGRTSSVFFSLVLILTIPSTVDGFEIVASWILPCAHGLGFPSF